jgi:hypothetical protein
MMAECYDQDQEDRYRHVHRRLATSYRPAPPPPVPPHPPDDGEENESHRPPVVVVAAAAANSTAAAAANTAAQLFGGSFQFIVQEQAKSMVAIQVKIASHTFLSLYLALLGLAFICFIHALLTIERN